MIVNEVKDLREIAVGSENRIKIQAVKNAVTDGVAVVACAAESGVRVQPLSEEETLQGAINRACDCLQKCPHAQVAIGLEAGIVFKDDAVYLCHFGALVDRKNGVYFSNGPLILLPPSFKEPLLAGQSLEDVMHQSTGIEKLGKKEGAIGIFTDNSINREQMLTQIAQVLLGQYSYYTK